MGKFFIMFFTLALIIIVPLLSIWRVNALFSTGIPYSTTTWIASMWLTFLVLNQSNREKKQV